MTCVSEETRAELKAATREYVLLQRRSRDNRARLRAAIVAEKKEGTSVALIVDDSPYRRGRVTAILDDAGLVEKKPRDSDEPAPA